MATVPSPVIFKPTHPNEQKLFFINGNNNNNNRNYCGSLISCKAKKEEEGAWEETKVGFVDYDKGKHSVSVQVSGLRINDIPKRYQLRVEGHRSQKDLTISEVVQRILNRHHREDIDRILNTWIGRFARKNFPVLIRVILFSN